MAWLGRNLLVWLLQKLEELLSDLTKFNESGIQYLLLFKFLKHLPPSPPKKKEKVFELCSDNLFYH